MKLTLKDGRSELWQWDTGRAVSTDAPQVHFAVTPTGKAYVVKAAGGFALIPDALLQSGKPLKAWAFEGSEGDGYTKVEETFPVHRRNKPADYVFTQADQETLQGLKEWVVETLDAFDGGVDTATDSEVAAIFDGDAGTDHHFVDVPRLARFKTLQDAANLDLYPSDAVTAAQIDSYFA